MSSPTNNHRNSTAARRIQTDLKTIEDTKPDPLIIFANSIDGNPLAVEAAITGPPSTPYENGIFLINILFSEQYPYFPPKSIIFKRATMHPNVNEYGGFMSEILKIEFWTPAMTVQDILEHVWIRLAIPAIDSNECDPTRTQSYKTDIEKFELLARDYSVRYAAAV